MQGLLDEPVTSYVQNSIVSVGGTDKLVYPPRCPSMGDLYYSMRTRQLESRREQNELLFRNEYLPLPEYIPLLYPIGLGTRMLISSYSGRNMAARLSEPIANAFRDIMHAIRNAPFILLYLNGIYYFFGTSGILSEGIFNDATVTNDSVTLPIGRASAKFDPNDRISTGWVIDLDITLDTIDVHQWTDSYFIIRLEHRIENSIPPGLRRSIMPAHEYANGVNPLRYFVLPVNRPELDGSIVMKAHAGTSHLLRDYYTGDDNRTELATLQRMNRNRRDGLAVRRIMVIDMAIRGQARAYTDFIRHVTGMHVDGDDGSIFYGGNGKDSSTAPMSRLPRLFDWRADIPSNTYAELVGDFSVNRFFTLTPWISFILDHYYIDAIVISNLTGYEEDSIAFVRSLDILSIPSIRNIPIVRPPPSPPESSDEDEIDDDMDWMGGPQPEFRAWQSPVSPSPSPPPVINFRLPRVSYSDDDNEKGEEDAEGERPFKRRKGNMNGWKLASLNGSQVSSLFENLPLDPLDNNLPIHQNEREEKSNSEDDEDEDDDFIKTQPYDEDEG